MFKCKRLLSRLFLTLMTLSLFYIPVYANAPFPDIFSESAVLMDAKTGKVLYGKCEHTQQYPASITKLITALLAIEGQSPDDVITMSKEAVFSIERGSSHIGLDVDEQITLDQGLHALLLASANEVANGIAELCDGSIEAFGVHASKRAKELGAKNTNFVNPHGLHDLNHYTSAYDMALIASELLKQPYFEEIMATHTYQIPATNRCEEIRYLSQPHKLLHEKRYPKTSREDVIGGKTGYTTQAGNTLVTMARRGDIELIAVVLKSNRANLYVDTNMILDYGFENYKSISLDQQDDIVQSLPMYSVKSGQLIHIADCDVCVEECVSVLARNDLKTRMIDSLVSLPTTVDQDVALGDIVGTISYDYEGQPLSISNLVIKNINYLPPLEDGSSPKEADNFIKASVFPSSFAIIFLVLALASFFIGWISTLYLKRRRYKKMRRQGKKIFRFSKTIK